MRAERGIEVFVRSEGAVGTGMGGLLGSACGGMDRLQSGGGVGMSDCSAGRGRAVEDGSCGGEVGRGG